jgi:hypothetical protein
MDVREHPSCSGQKRSMLLGISLEDAFIELLRSHFIVETEVVLQNPDPLLLSEDASAAYTRLNQLLGVIERHPALVCAGDDWDLVANRLVASGAISLEEARDDVLVHRYFWAHFLDGSWAAIGRLGTISAPDTVLEPFMWRSFTRARLRESAVEGNGHNSCFVGVRVYSREVLPSIPVQELIGRDALLDNLASRGIKTPALLEMGRAITELNIPFATPWSKELGKRLRSKIEETGPLPVGDDALRKRYRSVMKKFRSSAA